VKKQIQLEEEQEKASIFMEKENYQISISIHLAE